MSRRLPHCRLPRHSATIGSKLRIGAHSRLRAPPLRGGGSQTHAIKELIVQLRSYGRVQISQFTVDSTVAGCGVLDRSWTKAGQRSGQYDLLRRIKWQNRSKAQSHGFPTRNNQHLKYKSASTAGQREHEKLFRRAGKTLPRRAESCSAHVVGTGQLLR